MGLIDVQRRQAVVYRIRFGTKAQSKGKLVPVKLTDAIRVTADNPDVIDAFIDVYGGERKEWKPDKHRNEWEAYLPTRSLKIVLLPGNSLTQHWELWKGTVCERRCPGHGGIETKSGKPCFCPAADPADRTAAAGQCNPVTRVSVICPDVKVIGSGMFICNGLIAAETLPEAIANADAALRAGFFVPATLSVVEHRGRNHFIVPRIETVGISMFDMLESAEAQRALGEGSRGILGDHPRFTPVAELEAGVPPIRDQFGAVDTQTPKPRKGGAEPIRPTGLAPRTADDADQGVIDAEGEEDEPEPQPAVNRIAIAAREAGLDDNGRHQLCEWASEGRTRSSKELTEAEAARARDAAARIKAGTAHLDRDENDAAVLLDARFGWKTDPPASTGPTGPEGTASVPGAAGPSFTSDQIATMSGRELADALIALEQSPAGTPDELRARLMDLCNLTGEEPM